MQNSFPKICAHAGGSDYGPENSLKAAEKSMESLTERDMIELDLQETRDGEIVLSHGNYWDSLKNLIGRSGHIVTQNLRDLKSQNPDLCTLEEMLKFLDSRCGVFLDIKDISLNLGKVKEIVNSAHTGEVYISGANRKILTRAISEVPEWLRIASIGSTTRSNINGVIEQYKPWTIDVPPLLLRRKVAEYIQKNGVEFAPGGMGFPFKRWGENPNRIKNYIKWNASYILSFSPGKVTSRID